MPTPFDAANRILDVHIPGVGQARTIVAARLPFMTAGDRILAGAGPMVARPPQPHYLPPAANTALSAAIVANATATQQSGGVVDINVWAHALEQAGVSIDQIGAAYNGAGGDATLAPQEQRGNTSSFLGAFVAGLESQGVAAGVILSTYQQAGGQAGTGGVGGGGRYSGDLMNPGHAIGSFVGGAIKSVEQFISNPIGTVVGGVEHAAGEVGKVFKGLFG